MRRASRLVVAYGPPAVVRALPPVIGVLAALALPDARRRVAENLAEARGPVGRVRDARDVLSTFATYAQCFAEGLANGSRNAEVPDLVVYGKGYIDEAVSAGRGVVLVTVHTAGWDAVGPVLGGFYEKEFVLVMRPEADGEARALQDDARRAGGISVAHVGGDAFAALPLLRKLREGAVVAMQVDRSPPFMRARRVRIWGREGRMPEGPLRLAQLAGAPVLPVFCARLGRYRYEAVAFAPLEIARGADEGRLDVVAQLLADLWTGFVRRRPTQWFHFEDA